MGNRENSGRFCDRPFRRYTKSPFCQAPSPGTQKIGASGVFNFSKKSEFLTKQWGFEPLFWRVDTITPWVSFPEVYQNPHSAVKYLRAIFN